MTTKLVIKKLTLQQMFDNANRVNEQARSVEPKVQERPLPEKREADMDLPKLKPWQSVRIQSQDDWDFMWGHS